MKHWNDHKNDFPEFNNALEYVNAAQDFINNPPKTALTKIRANGDKVVYDPVSEIFAVGAKDGSPRTMYKPDPKIHKLNNNMEYFDGQ